MSPWAWVYTTTLGMTKNVLVRHRDLVFAASTQAASDLGVTLELDRLEPVDSVDVLIARMAAKITALCADGVDGLFITLPSSELINEVKVCQALGIPVMSINSGYDLAKELGLLHHVGQLEYSAGFKAGASMAASGMVHGVCVLDGTTDAIYERCSGFGHAINLAGGTYIGYAVVPSDSSVSVVSIIEGTVSSSNYSLSDDWADIGLLLVNGALHLEPALTLQQTHGSLLVGAFDTSAAMDAAIDAGTLLFMMDQQPYLQGYMPILLLTVFAYTDMTLSDFAIETGPHLVTSSVSDEESVCRDSEHLFAACQVHAECLPTFFHNQTTQECEVCGGGTYTDTVGTYECQQCPKGKYGPPTSGTCIDCSYGTYNDKPGRSEECEICPSGAECPYMTKMILKPGYWGNKVYSCPFEKKACPGGNMTGSCNRGYSGVLCAVCQHGYVQAPDHCADCNSLQTPITTIAVVVTITVVVLGTWYTSRTSKRFAAAMEAISLSVPLKVYFSTCQILGVFATLLTDVLFQPLKVFFWKILHLRPTSLILSAGLELLALTTRCELSGCG